MTEVHGVVLRSPHPHARIVSIDSTVALALPGVLLVLTGADVTAEGLQPIPYVPQAKSPPNIRLDNLDGSPHLLERPPILAVETVRFIGEAVAFVVAGTLTEARQAAEAIAVVYEVLPPIGDIAVDARVGNPPATRAGFAEADYVVRLETDIPRTPGASAESRTAVGRYDPAAGRYTVQGAGVRSNEIAFILGVAPEQVQGTGGEPGAFDFLYPEFALVAWASKKVGRPVTWTGEPDEVLASGFATGDFRIEAELAIAADGKFVGLHATSTSTIGAYTASFVPLTRSAELMTGYYDMPGVVRARAVLSNSASTAPERGADGPETMFAIERLIDMAARAHGFDRLDLRRRNLISQTPYRNAFGFTFVSGDSAGFEEVLQRADWTGHDARREASLRQGLRRGIGLGSVLKPAGWHVCEVEVDTETGVVRIDRHTASEVGRAAPPPAAMINAVVDALAEFGVTDIGLPLSPDRVRQAVREARG
jgi:carbon-monoxide dehydrogenase large subunit